MSPGDATADSTGGLGRVVVGVIGSAVLGAILKSMNEVGAGNLGTKQRVHRPCACGVDLPFTQKIDIRAHGQW